MIVARTELAPTDFAHAKLFAPRPKPAVDPVAQLDRPVRLAQNESATATDARPGEPDAAPTVAADEKRPVEAVKPADSRRDRRQARGGERRGHRGEAGGSSANG